jgi:Na+-transporting NADH:ubiquinone oxidoreductase subunit NqrC
MKKVGRIIIAVLCVVAVCGAFYYLKQRSDAAQNAETELTEVQKLITKNLDKNYPETPREVIKLYNRFITCFYKEDYTQEELSQMADQVWLLLDEQLQEENTSKDTYLASLEADIADYASRNRYIASSSVCDSADVVEKTIDGDKIAYVTSSYFVREGSGYERTYQEYVLRKDSDGNWKIMGFYQVEGASSEDE